MGKYRLRYQTIEKPLIHTIMAFLADTEWVHYRDGNHAHQTETVCWFCRPERIKKIVEKNRSVTKTIESEIQYVRETYAEEILRMYLVADKDAVDDLLQTVHTFIAQTVFKYSE